MTNAAALIWALLFGGEGGGGGGGEPAAYIKSAVVSDDGKTLTLTKKSGATVSFSVSDLAAAVAGKQDVISDIATIRTGAGKGATSVQTVNGEEPDEDGNVNVSASEGEVITVADEASCAPAWGDVVDVSFTMAITCAIAIPNTDLSSVVNKVIRVIFTAGDGGNVSFSMPSGAELLWANNTPWNSAAAPESGKVYEFVISRSYGSQYMASWTEFTRSI